MYGTRMFSIVGCKCSFSMGSASLLPCSYSGLVSLRLDYAFCSSGKTKTIFKSKLLKLFLNFFHRMGPYLLTNLILSLDGFSGSLQDHIYFYVHYSIQRYDGAKERLSFIGVASPTKQNRELSHSRY